MEDYYIIQIKFNQKEFVSLQEYPIKTQAIRATNTISTQYLLFMEFSGEHDEAVNQREIYSVFGQSYKPDQKKCKSQ